MKYSQLLFVAAALTAALTASAGSASATSVSTTTGGVAATPTVHLVNEKSHVVMTNAITNIECPSTFEGNVAGHGSAAPAVVSVTTFSLFGCTNSWHYTTLNAGTLAFHWSNGHDGTLTWTGARLTSTRFGITCNYETNNTPIGTITGGSPATVDLEANIPLAAGSSSLCGFGNSIWEGRLVTTSALYVVP